MTTSRVGPRTLGHRAVGVAAALALGLAASTTVGADAAQAAETEITGGFLDWGFKESFRSYISSGDGDPPIAASDGASITTNGTFQFPVTGGTYDDETGAVTVNHGGTVVFSYPSHGFQVTLANPTVVLDGQGGELLADVELSSSLPAYEPVTATQAAVALIDTGGAPPRVDGGTVRYSGLNTTITETGQAAFANFYPVGTALDPLSFAFSTDGSTPAAPTVTATPATGLDPDGATVQVSGTGFDPASPGIYVAFGALAEGQWWLDAGRFKTTKWVRPGATPSASQDVLNPDGTFSTTLDVVAAYTDQSGEEIDCRVVQCYVVTMKAHGSADRSQDTLTPVSFGTATPPGGGSGTARQELTVERGRWSADPGRRRTTRSPLPAPPSAAPRPALCNPATVEDLRGTDAGWSLVGQSSDFTADTGTIPADQLGWAPSASGGPGTVSPGFGRPLRARQRPHPVPGARRIQRRHIPMWSTAHPERAGDHGTGFVPGHAHPDPLLTDLTPARVVPTGATRATHATTPGAPHAPLPRHPRGPHGGRGRRRAGVAAPVVAAPAAPAPAAAATTALATVPVTAAPATATPAAPDGRRRHRHRDALAAQPSGPDGPTGRQLVRLRPRPGQEIVDRVAVTNYSEIPLDFQVYATDAYTTQDGGFALLTADGRPRDVGAWIALDSGTYQVPAGHRLDIPFRVVVPDNATPGDHARGGIVASVTTRRSDATGQQVDLDQRVAARVYLRVSGPAAPGAAGRVGPRRLHQPGRAVGRERHDRHLRAAQHREPAGIRHGAGPGRRAVRLAAGRQRRRRRARTAAGQHRHRDRDGDRARARGAPGGDGRGRPGHRRGGAAAGHPDRHGLGGAVADPRRARGGRGLPAGPATPAPPGRHPDSRAPRPARASRPARRARLFGVAGIALLPLALAGAAAAPQVTVDADSATVGERTLVRLAGWPAGNVLVEVCGNEAARGSADCAVASAAQTYVPDSGDSVVRLTVTARRWPARA